jgi:hypothetical protein
MSKTLSRKSQPVQPAALASPRSIISPAIDLACCGGLSLVAFTLFLGYRLTLGIQTPDRFDLGEITLVAALVNWPHFMASYRLLYSSRVQITRHKWASIGVPAVLLGVMAVALATPGSQEPGKLFVNPRIGLVLMLVSHLYLAWHYTGQAWGMVAAFAYVDGIRMDETERRMIRSGMRLLLVWHVVWASQDIGEYYEINVPFDAVFKLLAVFGLATLLLGTAGFRGIARRTGRTPSLRMIAPWAALYMWYVVLYVQPSAFFWVQISHALQYLIFPIRVELNQHASAGSPAAVTLRAIAYYLALVAVGLAVFYVPAELIAHGHPQNNLARLIAASVNVHHYFVDGVIWKIRNPEVQKTLFAHFEAK